MMRLALGAKLGKPANPPVALAWASRLRRVARAARPGTLRVRRWRRVGRTSFIGDYLVQIQNQAGHRGVGGKVGGIQAMVSWRVSVIQEFFCRLRIVAVSCLEAVKRIFQDLLLRG